MIAIIDYGSGNVAAIANIYKRLRIPHLITADPGVLDDAERYILPGVGAFDATMHYLYKSGLVDLLTEQIVKNKKNVLGICVGMQILAGSSEEGEQSGLGWIEGRVKKIDVSSIAGVPKLPHMGWNSVLASASAPLFDGVNLERGFYFLHSYYFDPSNASDVTAVVDYGANLPCAVARGNVFGMQFHPEKSHSNGERIFRNFAAL
jgi:glutamine amidotransferase